MPARCGLGYELDFATRKRSATPELPLFRHAFLLRELVRRDLQGRYAASLFGFLWSFLQPLWQLVLFTFVFSTVLQVPVVGGGRTGRFAIFLFAGLLPWMAVQEGLSRATTAITDQASLVKKLSFPSELLVLTSVLAAAIHASIGGLVFVVLLAGTGELAWSSLPWLLLAVPLQIALTLGLGLLAAALQVVFRDIVQIVAMALSAWFYCTPIVYPLSLVPGRAQAWIAANPLSALVGLYRTALLDAPLPATEQIARLSAGAAVGLAFGLWLFRRLRSRFADEV